MTIRAEIRGHAATVTIANPESLNALFLADLQTLSALWDELEADSRVRVVVVTGEGDRAFCSGANLKELIPIVTDDLRRSSDPYQTLSGMTWLHRAFLKPGQLSKPLIAAVNGLCFAGGVELLNACDLRVAVEGAVFSLQEPRWGLFPAGGSVVRLPRQIPYPWAMEMLLTGGRLTAREALAAGLINRVVPAPELWGTVNGLAGRIAANGPLAVRNIKRAVRACLELPLDKAFDEELRWAAEVLASDDALEGARAFAEKREPNYQGR
jgi:enoyl-CoA hydratase